MSDKFKHQFFSIKRTGAELIEETELPEQAEFVIEARDIKYKSRDMKGRKNEYPVQVGDTYSGPIYLTDELDFEGYDFTLVDNRKPGDILIEEKQIDHTLDFIFGDQENLRKNPTDWPIPVIPEGEPLGEWMITKDLVGKNRFILTINRNIKPLSIHWIKHKVSLCGCWMKVLEE